MSRRVFSVAVLILVAVLTAACGSSTPDEYNDSVQEDFVFGCARTNTEAGGSEEDARDRCTCAYEALSSEVPFEEFLAVEEQLEDDPDAFPDDWLDYFTNCGIR